MRDTLIPQLRDIRQLAASLQPARPPILLAGRLIELQALTGPALREALEECLEKGLSWRMIGAELEIPFQTLQRQYAKGGPIILQAGGAR